MVAELYQENENEICNVFFYLANLCGWELQPQRKKKKNYTELSHCLNLYAETGWKWHKTW